MICRSIEGGALCKLRSRLVVAAGGSRRFGCQHPAPLSAFEAGAGTLSG